MLHPSPKFSQNMFVNKQNQTTYLPAHMWLFFDTCILSYFKLRNAYTKTAIIYNSQKWNYSNEYQEEDKLPTIQ